ncbi:MAG: glycosyltransferase family 4 protein, partial [Betaproteobacteria bacterium]
MSSRASTRGRKVVSAGYNAARRSWSLHAGAHARACKITLIDSSMRIAIVSPEFPPDIGGVETYAFEYVKELASRGHEVTVFTVHHARGEAELPGVRIEPVLRLCRAIDRETFARFNADVWHALNAAYAWIANERPVGLVSVYGNDFLRPYYPIAQPDLRHFPLAWRWSDAVSRRLRPLWLRLTAPVVRRSMARSRHIIACSRYTERVLLQRIPECG